MTMTPLIHVLHSACRNYIVVPETILEDIFQHLQESSTGEEQLRLVCQVCKVPFLFDFRQRRKSAVGRIPLPLDKAMDCAWFAIEAECDPSNSCLPITLIAIRVNGTSNQDVEREFPAWSERGLSCMEKHPIVKMTLLET
jgi:hypothetical protein